MQAFAVWKGFVPYNPFQYMGGVFSVMKEVPFSESDTWEGIAALLPPAGCLVQVALKEPLELRQTRTDSNLLFFKSQ